MRCSDFHKAGILYAVCRVASPDVVFETGVASETSSLGILSALESNGHGELVSIDPANVTHDSDQGMAWTDPVPAGSTGCRGPTTLRGRWKLLIGASKSLLPQAVDKVRRINTHYHDSQHTKENVVFELGIVWPKLQSGGLLVVDNVNWSTAFHEFCIGKRLKNSIVFPFLGVARVARGEEGVFSGFPHLLHRSP